MIRLDRSKTLKRFKTSYATAIKRESDDTDYKDYHADVLMVIKSIEEGRPDIETEILANTLGLGGMLEFYSESEALALQALECIYSSSYLFLTPADSLIVKKAIDALRGSSDCSEVKK